MKNDVVGVGLIGCGGFSGDMADVVKRSKKAELIACFDIIPEKREEFSKRYVCDYEKNYEAVLERSDIDGVILVSPNSLHAEQTILAAEHGKHVLVQKPIANLISDARRMIEACHKNGVILSVAHNQRRLAAYRKMKNMVETGSLGKTVMVETNFSHNAGFRLTPQAWRWYEAECPGGPIMTNGIHAADTLQYLLGPIQSVTSYLQRLCISAEIIDTGMSIFEFESGTLGYLGSNFVTPWVYYFNLYGTEANLYFTADLPPRRSQAPGQYRFDWNHADHYSDLYLKPKGEHKRIKLDLKSGEALLEEMEEFADCIRCGRSPEVSGQEGMQALAVILAVIRSAKSGKPIKISEILEE